MKKSLIFYPIFVIIFTCLIWFIIDKGKSLVPKSEQTSTTLILSQKNTIEKAQPLVINSNETVFEQFSHNIKSPLGLFLLQIIIILITSRLFAVILVKIGQPSVIGEIIAGIFLGPSIIGMLFPDFSHFLFPANSLNNLQFLSQIGLVFFMFIIGMELDIEKLKNKTQDAVVISHSSIVVPFFLGVIVSYLVYEQFAPAGISFLAFSLFMGIAMSITAFPVLARIVQERKLTKTALGVIVITCAAADDVTAWCILAFVIAVVKAGGINSALFTLILAAMFVFIMFYIIKPWLKKLSEKQIQHHNLSKTMVAIIFFMLLTSAYISEIIGIHALFGAFLAGVIIPENVKFKEIITEKLEDVSVLVLLPIFFAFTGLRTQIGLLNEGHLWTTCLFIIIMAVVGKFGASAISAKLMGHNWFDSLSIGAFMNTRGLMELIVLNIGYDLGILSPQIFAIMVLMALSTTFMTGPFLDFIKYLHRRKII